MTEPKSPKPSQPSHPVVPKKDGRPPDQSQTDEERSDWEGMGQARYQPEEDVAAPPGGKPTPKASSAPGTKG